MKNVIAMLVIVAAGYLLADMTVGVLLEALTEIKLSLKIR